MRGLFCLLIFVVFVFSPIAYSSENIHSDEIIQLKTLNGDLNRQLLTATQELVKLQDDKNSIKITNEIKEELEKARREIANQSCEIKMLREKMMISKDYALNGE